MLFLFIFVLSGCGVGEKLIEKQVEKNVEKQMNEQMGADVDVDMNKNSVNIVTEDGASIQVGEGTVLPKGFPDDVYVGDGDIVSASKNLSGEGFQVTMVSNKNIDYLKQKYTGEVTTAGWDIDSDMSMAGVTIVTANKDNRVLSLSFSPDTEQEGKAMIVLIVMEN